MNKDRDDGAAKEIEGPFQVGVGEVLTDAQLPAEGRVEGAEGGHHKAIGVLTDTLSKADARLLTEGADKPEVKPQAAGVLTDAPRE